METPDNLVCSVPGLAPVSRLSPNSHRLVVVLAALVLSLPCLISGIPATGDGVTHAQYQHDFSNQFWTGDLYPRWLMNSNKGYGSPVFLVQYPLPYWTTALIRPIVRFRPGPTRAARELGVFCFLALAAAGLGAFVWFDHRFGPLAATAGAIVYITLPYILATELYQGAALGMLSASVWMPWALAACDSLRLTFRSVSTLGIVLALLVMSNLISLVLFFPLMIGYAIACRETNRISLGKCSASLLFALSIGLGIAGAYLLPFFVYRRLFDLSAFAFYSPGMQVGHNFSFLRGTSLAKPLIVAAVSSAAIITAIAACYVWRARKGMGRVFMLLVLASGATILVPGLGLTLIRASGLTASNFHVDDYFPERMLAVTLSTLALGVLAYSSLPEKAIRWRDRVLMLVACSSFVLMLPWSAFAWKAVPKLATAIEFPHRFGAILVLAVAGLFAAAIESGLRRRPSREEVRCVTIVTLVALLVIASGALTWRADWRWARGLGSRAAYAFDESQDVDFLYRTYVPRDRIAAFAALLGTTPSTYFVEPTPAVHGNAKLVQGQGAVDVISREPRNVVLSFEASENSVVRIAQLYSPLWKGVLLDRTSCSLDPRNSDEGLIELSLVPGPHYLKLLFEIGWSERYGVILTVVSLVVVVGGVLFELYSNDRARGNAGTATIGWGPGKRK